MLYPPELRARSGLAAAKYNCRRAYGVPIAAEIAHKTGREMLQGSVYATWERLEGKGLVTSHLGDTTPQRAGAQSATSG
jgi:Transcriptional regulator PadR-like family